MMTNLQSNYSISMKTALKKIDNFTDKEYDSYQSNLQFKLLQDQNFKSIKIFYSSCIE